jgi:CRP-like cAMP-binding protein
LSIKNIILDFFIDKYSKEKIEFLSNFKIFKDLNNKELRRIFSIMQCKTYQANEIVFYSHKIGKAVFFVYSGKVIIQDDKSQKVKECVKGDSLGELAFFEETPRMFTAITSKISEIFIIYKSNFDDLVSRYPDIKSKIIKNDSFTVIPNS